MSSLTSLQADPRLHPNFVCRQHELWPTWPNSAGRAMEAKRPRSSPERGPCEKKAKTELHLRQRAVALRRRHALAGSLGDILPVMRIVIDGRGAGAGGAGAGGAVVLAGEGDAVALSAPGWAGAGPALAAVASAPASEAASAAAVMAVLAFICSVLPLNQLRIVWRGGPPRRSAGAFRPAPKLYGAKLARLRAA